MKNVLKASFLYALCVTICVSCSKKTEESIPENKCDYVNSWGFLDYAGKPTHVTYFTYDNNGRVTSLKSDGLIKSTFQYSKNSITVDAVEFDGSQSKRTYNLDGNGHITSDSKYSYNCKYDSQGYLIAFDKPSISPNGAISYTPFQFTYKDGNLVKITAPEPYYSGQVSDITYYDKPAQSCSGLNTPLFLTGFVGRDQAMLVHAGYFGKASKNLVNEIKFSSNSYISPIPRTYDNKGRVILTNGVVYTYQCD
jgi:hypothetical protein